MEEHCDDTLIQRMKFWGADAIRNSDGTRLIDIDNWHSHVIIDLTSPPGLYGNICTLGGGL
ncbi:MAG TPA: hypothetical protein DEG06_12290 [Lachnospiraceae bacterium]|nr:hypothetical protein [Lachnospiraceae bacterium]